MKRDDFMDANLKRSIILEHYQNPVNRGLIEDETYYKADTTNDSCIDEIHLMAKIEDGKIVDAKFDGEACAICTSSTSVMLHTLIGKTVEEAEAVLNEFQHMINEEPYQEEILEEAIVYDDVYQQPNRKKCALLPWWGMEKILNQEKEKQCPTSEENKN